MNKRERFLDAYKTEYPSKQNVTKEDLVSFALSQPGLYTKGTAVGLYNSLVKIDRNTRNLVFDIKTHSDVTDSKMHDHDHAASSTGTDNILSEVFVPQKNVNFVKWGHFNDIKNIVMAKMFCPILVTGLSGNGKTMMVEQCCAHANRKFVRVQITPETDEDDLIGGFRLINGNTIFEKGPVIKAMEAGAVFVD